ncbi:hypothetical protein GH714_008976 [Hevea brasiliensis]|nr:hypothetical protein GH714_008976 [Hevea brasiliensis]
MFPLVICAEASLPSLFAAAEADQPLPTMSPHAQISQAVLDKNNEGHFQVKIVKQVLWIEGVRYELREIYGFGNSFVSDFDDRETEKECVICMTEPKDTAVLPCRHMQTCVLKVNIQCHCDGCKKKIRKLLQKVDGVYNATINAEQGKVTVTGNVDPAKLIKKLEKSGKHAELWGAPRGFNNYQNLVNNQFKNMQTGNDVNIDASDDDFDDEFDDEYDELDDDSDDEDFGHGYGPGQGHQLPNKMMPMMGNGYGLQGPHGMINGPMLNAKKGGGGGGGEGNAKKGGGDFEMPVVMKGKGNNNYSKNGNGGKKGGGGDGKNSHSKGGSEKQDGKGKNGGKSGIGGFLSFGRKSKNGREGSTDKSFNNGSSAGNYNSNGAKKGGGKMMGSMILTKSNKGTVKLMLTVVVVSKTWARWADDGPNAPNG